jgi:hypothetical protein
MAESVKKEKSVKLFTHNESNNNDLKVPLRDFLFFVEDGQDKKLE